MTIGSKIAYYRKQKRMTQDALAQQLGVTNQAVSKWESDQSCPDILLLPQLADLFGVTIDELFDRKPRGRSVVDGLPWRNDGTLRVVMYIGHTLIGSSSGGKDLVFTYEGPALNIDSAISVQCGDVDGNVNAGAGVSCGNVGGDVYAGTDANCGDVGGGVDAGMNVTCGNVGGDVDAGVNVTCGDVGGDVDAGCAVECGNVAGDIDACGPVTIRK